MQKKLNKFLEQERLRYSKFVEALTFEQLKKISVDVKRRW